MPKRRRPEKAETSEYTDDEGNVLELRQSLSAGTARKIARLEGKSGSTSEDVWQRREEMLFERLVVRWEIAGLPLDSQKELLGRYRMASFEERRAVRDMLAEHLHERLPGVEL
jgi:hypothetical protein